MKVISFDVEVFYSSKLKYGLRNMLVDQFVKHELFDVYQIAVSDGTQSWAGAIKDFNWTSLEGAHVVSHNARFDETCYLELVERGLAPKLNIPKWSCTADLTSYLANRRALSHAVEYFYGVKLSKAARDDSNGRHFPADFTPAQQEDMRTYGRSDAAWCYRLWAEHSHKWPESEQRLSLMTRLQGRRGVAINAELLDQYIIQSHEMKIATERLLPWLQDDDDEDSWQDFNTKPTSTKCIAEACRRAGIPAPPVKSHYDNGEELYDEWENTYKKNNPWISALSSWRTCNRLYKTFLTAKARLRPDGTMPFGLKYMGAATGRWSGDSGLNMHNFSRRPVYCRQDGLMETDDAREPGDWVKYELDFRRLIVPRKGTVMIVSDLSQVEPRCMAWLCGDTELLKLVAEGQSLYEAHARTALGWTGGDLKKENPALYSEAKARCIAEGTLILTNRGYVPVEKVKKTDLLWDGVAWVQHDGLINNGKQKVINVGHERYTYDHKIFIADNPTLAGEIPAGSVSAELERKLSPGSGWADLYRLACAVALACASAGVSVCVLSVSKMQKSFLRGSRQFIERAIQTLRGVLSITKLGRAEPKNLGVPTGQN